jgi:branched-chain amino acid aminotransferase
LSGITRDTAINLLRESGIDVEKRSIKISELVDVTSCFLTSTAGEIINVSHIDGRRLNSECNDVLEIISNYRSLVTGKTNTRSEWITYV